MLQSKLSGIVLSVFAASLTGSFSFAAEKKFASPVVNQAVEGNSTPIELDITGARILALEVADGGDGTSYDWADWIEPRLIGPKGELKLTELKWRKLDGKATVGKNNGGGPPRSPTLIASAKAPEDIDDDFGDSLLSKLLEL